MKVRFAATLVVTLVAIAIPSPAGAYHLEGGRWPTATITYYNEIPAYAWAVDSAAYAWNTSGARVRFLKSSRRDAKVLVFDEPTAVLTPQETDELMQIMRQLREAGTAIVFITHKLREVREVADRITVIRLGKVVGEASPTATNEELASMMVGRAVDLTVDKVLKFTASGPTSQLPKCPGTLAKKDIQNRVFYCLNSNYIAFDEPLLNNIYNKIGDFGVATLIGDTYATYIQFKQNFPGVQNNTVNAVLGADCYTGAWAQAVAQGLPSTTLNSTVTLSPGDLDKAIQAFITYDTARGVSVKSDFVFRRVEAFRKGFFSDFATCTRTYANSSTPSS